MNTRWVLVVLACSLSAISARAQIAVNGNLKTFGVQNASIANSLVRFRLTNFARSLPVMAGSGAIVRENQDYAAEANGDFHGSIVANDTILPANTLYSVCVYSDGVEFRCATYSITVAKYPNGFDLNTATPIRREPDRSENTPMSPQTSGASPNMTERQNSLSSVSETGAQAVANRATPTNQAVSTSFYLDYVRPNCTGPAIVANTFTSIIHAEDTPTYQHTIGTSTPCYDVASQSIAIRSGSRTDSIWAINPVVQYANAGDAQGAEIDCNNEYQDYVVGGADTHVYSCLSVVNGTGYKGDRGFSVTGPFQRGIYVNGWANRAIEFAGSPGAYALYADQNNTNYIGGTWKWVNDASSHPIFNFRPQADDTHAEIYGTNSRGNAIRWQVDNSGNGSFAAIKVGEGAPLATSDQSGSGSLCMTTSCAMMTPTIGGGSVIHRIYRVPNAALNSAFTSIVAGRCQDQTITLSGVTVGAIATANPAASLGESFNWQSWVSDANTISVHVCAGASGTPKPVRWNIVVIQ